MAGFQSFLGFEMQSRQARWVAVIFRNHHPDLLIHCQHISIVSGGTSLSVSIEAMITKGSI